MAAKDNVQVVNNLAGRRFEIASNDGTAFLRYIRKDLKLHLVHTEVPRALEGHGLAAILARTALEYARDEHLRVVAECPFVAAYIARHPEFQELLDSA